MLRFGESSYQLREENSGDAHQQLRFFLRAITRRTNSKIAWLTRETREMVVPRRDWMIGANVVYIRKKKEKHMIQNTNDLPRPFFGPVSALNLRHG
jgi:hypothetical protein